MVQGAWTLFRIYQSDGLCLLRTLPLSSWDSNAGSMHGWGGLEQVGPEAEEGDRWPVRGSRPPGYHRGSPRL